MWVRRGADVRDVGRAWGGCEGCGSGVGGCEGCRLL